MKWLQTIKFRIVALAAVTAVLAAVATAQLVLRTTQDDIERLLLDSGASARESTAALMASKLDLLRQTLSAVARDTPPPLWLEQGTITRHLVAKSAMNTLFDTVLAANAQGRLVARIVKGVPSDELPDVADRPYFQQAIKTDIVVISEPIVGRASKLPQIIMAAATPVRDGTPTGIVAGALRLESAGLFSNLGLGDLRDGSRSMVINRAGLVLAHTDQSRVMAKAISEPGFSEVYLRWHEAGSPVTTEGSATLSSGYLISMAGIAGSDWMLVRMTPQSIALQPLAAAQRAAWLSAAAVGLVAGLIAAWFGLRVTRPMDRLRDRAMASLTDAKSNLAPWPANWGGELGELARVFQHVEDERERRQNETRALLQQLEAVLDHAQVGIALTRNGMFELVSTHFANLFGMKKHQMEGQPTRIIYESDEAFAQLAARARPQFMEQGFFAGEVQLIRAGGELFWANMRGRAVVPGDMSKGTIWTFEDVTDARAQREKLTWSSNHDALTGLANRPAFEKLLADATAVAHDAPFCALFIDLDRFKAVNDTGGHAAGDAVLRDVAKALLAQVRKSDTVARLGGDEFAVLLANCPLHQARDIAEKLRIAVVDYELAWEGHAFSVGASIGLVRVDERFAAIEDVLAAADAACYAAKHQGRNRVVVHGEYTTDGGDGTRTDVADTADTGEHAADGGARGSASAGVNSSSSKTGSGSSGGTA